jgi:phosphatidylglycerol---prolipoprotein diacylglyceryl transferase
MLPNISIGPLTFPTAGLILLVGIWLALTFIERSARSLRLNAELIYSLSVVILASGFVGARLLFVVLRWSAFQNDLLGIIWPITSGYEIVGGLIAGVLTGFFYGRYRELPWLSTLDAVAPGIVVGLAAVSLADFLGGSGYGTVTSLPWAIDVFGIRRHPVQIYELLIAGLALAAWWRFRPRRTVNGKLSLVTAAVYSGGRLFFDAFRANAWLTTSGYRGSQIVSLAILLASVFLLGWLVREKEEPGASGSGTANPHRH